MSYGLKALHKLASSPTIDKLGMRESVEKMVYRGTKNGFKAVATVGRQFAKQKGDTQRQKPSKPSGLFDLTPTEEQQMLQEAFGEFAMSELRPVAEQADHDCAAPKELLDQCNELGATMIGVPEELGGAVAERSAVTSVLIGEALAQGDLGLAFAALAPSAVSTAIGLWGSGDQQATYLPAFVGEDVPAAALAVIEPKPVFDPAKLSTKAIRSADGFTLSGVKSLVPRGAEAELFVVAAELDGKPALFIVEANTDGITAAPEPAMGLRAAATARVEFSDVSLPANALLGEDATKAYRECIALGRIAWSALAVGTSQAALDFLIPYVNERVAFGEPISHRQAVAFKVSDISIELGGIRLATYRAASLADAGNDFAREAALARQLTAKYGMQIGSDAVQLLGGHGYVKEYPAERWYRDLRAAGLMEGALLV
jgi:alkylation response protein AidB-like acyl-CoA dehydrogenase